MHHIERGRAMTTDIYEATSHERTGERASDRYGANGQPTVRRQITDNSWSPHSINLELVQTEDEHQSFTDISGGKKRDAKMVNIHEIQTLMKSDHNLAKIVPNGKRIDKSF